MLIESVQQAGLPARISAVAKSEHSARGHAAIRNITQSAKISRDEVATLLEMQCSGEHHSDKVAAEKHLPTYVSARISAL
jgi:hypothetical protein